MKYLKTIGMINNLAIERGFLGPGSSALSSDGRIFVLDCYHYTGGIFRITVQDFDENFLFEFASSQGDKTGDKIFKNPSDLEFDSEDKLYVNYEILNAVLIYDSKGDFHGQWGDFGSKEGELSGPSGIAIDSKDDLFIVYQYNHRIQKFTKEGKFLYAWGNFGNKEGEFNLPWGICVDKNDDIYVADWRNDRIQKFSNEGKFLDSFVSGGGLFIRPSDVVVDSIGTIYVSDWGNERVVALNSSGEFIFSERGNSDSITEWTKEFFESNPDERDTRAIANLVPDLPEELQTPYHISSQSEPLFWGVTDLTIDSQDRLFVTEHRRHRLQIFV